MSITRHPTRRALLIGSGALATGALPLVPVRAAPASDRELLALMAVVEQVQIDHYAALLDAFADHAFAAEDLPEGSRARVETMLRAEEAQLAALDGATVVPTGVVVTGSLREALAGALELENFAVAAYAGVIPRLGRQGLIPELVGIHSADARHAAWLASLLGSEPFAAPIDASLAPGEVVARLEAMVSSPSSGATPTAMEEGATLAISAIAAELGVAEETIQVVSVEPRDWPDTSLGCPREGEVYAEVITPGYEIVVVAEGEEVVFHADREGAVVRCP
jgi:hypothetical protein